MTTEPIEPQEISGETRIYRRYMELGRIASDASAERKAIKETDIDPMLDEGVVFGDRNRCLRRDYSVRTDFDWKKAIADGKIPADVAKEYTKISVVVTLRDAKTDEDETDVERRRNIIRYHALDLYQYVIGSLDHEGSLAVLTPIHAMLRGEA